MFLLFGSSLAFLGVKISLDSVFLYGPVVAVIIFDLPCFISVLRQRKLRGLLIFLLVALVAFGVQVLAVKTQFISGKFTYDNIIGRQIFGVPWVVAAAYPPVVLGAYWIARKIHNGWLAPVLSALFVTSAGVVIDPVAVKLEFWKWEHGGVFWGVPPVNFVAWFLAGLVAAWITHKLWGDKPVKRGAAFSLLGILLFWSGANLGTDQWIPAAVGLFVSAIYLTMMWREKHRAGKDKKSEPQLDSAPA